MSYIGIPPFGQTVRTVTTATATAGQTTFNITGGYIVGYLDVFLNGVLLAPADITVTDGLTVVLATGAALNDEFQAIAYQPTSFVDSLKASSNLADLVSASSARTNLGLGSAATQSTSAFLQPSNNLSDVSSTSTARTNLGLAIGTDVQAYDADLATLASSGFGTSANQIPRMDSSGRLPIGANWTVAESGGVLYFAHSGTNKFKIDSSGNLTVTGNVTAYGTV